MALKRLDKGRVSLGKLLTFSIGGGLLFFVYRRWQRRKSAHSHEDRKPRDIVQAEADGQAEKLSEKFYSLDQKTQSGHIPKDLEKEPKNLDQAMHPG
jgi:hypothetical protein